MDNNSDEQFLIMQAKIESNKQESYEKTKNIKEYLKALVTSTITSVMGHMNIYKSSL